jgi:hypothetical protein
MASPDSRELKKRLLTELNHARVDVLAHGRLAKEELSPRALVSRSVAEHKTAWIVAGAIAGLVLIRVALPPKIRSDNSHRPYRTSWLSGILSTVVTSLAKRAAGQFASSYLKDSAQNYITSLFQRPGPPPS